MSSFHLYYSIDLEKSHLTNELLAIRKQRRQILTLAIDGNAKEPNTIENLHYIPFQTNVYTDWTADTAIETVDILDKVTAAQKFQAS